MPSEYDATANIIVKLNNVAVCINYCRSMKISGRLRCNIINKQRAVMRREPRRLVALSNEMQLSNVDGTCTYNLNKIQRHIRVVKVHKIIRFFFNSDQVRRTTLEGRHG